MGRYTIRRHIEASPEAVFQAFSDPQLMADWMDASGVVGPSGPLGVSGTSFTLVIRGPWRFRTEVIRSEPPRIHDTKGVGPLGASYRMMATLVASGGGTDLELLTEYTVPLGAIGRWIDLRWIDREPRATANREVDRLVELATERPNGAVSDPRAGAGAGVRA
jgi:hypothetical protein